MTPETPKKSGDSPADQPKIRTADQLSDEEAEKLTDGLEPKVRFALFLRKKRTFNSALEMKKGLIENTRLSQDIVSELISSFHKDGLAVFDKVLGDTEECFAVLTEVGLAFLNAAIIVKTKLTPEERRMKKIKEMAAEPPVMGYKKEPKNDAPRSHSRHNPKTKSGRRTGDR